MNWITPEDWKYAPETKPANDDMLMGMIFELDARWQKVRNPWFRRCNASGRWIWPGQTMWVGIVRYELPKRENLGGVDTPGNYSIAYLNTVQYLVQKLKGAI